MKENRATANHYANDTTHLHRKKISSIGKVEKFDDLKILDKRIRVSGVDIGTNCPFKMH